MVKFINKIHNYEIFHGNLTLRNIFVINDIKDN